MSTATISAEINKVDIPLFEALFKRVNAKKITIKEEGKKMDYKKPNETTLQAIKEIEDLKKDKNKKGFSDIKELMAFLND